MRHWTFAVALLALPLLVAPAPAVSQDGGPEVIAPKPAPEEGDTLEGAMQEELSGAGTSEESSQPEEPPAEVTTQDALPAEPGAGAAAEPAAPAADTAAPEQPAPEQPAPEQPAPEQPATEQPATEQPATGSGEAAPSEPKPEPSADETAEQKGQRLAQESSDQESGWRWQSANGRMVLLDAQGNRNERAFESRILEDQDKSDEETLRGIIVFKHPPDIENTALLTIGQKVADDYQWLYLPALKRVKRISGSSKTGSFVGSEFSFEDLSARDIDDYTHIWLAQEPCPGAAELTCEVVERRPKDSESGYSKIVTWQESETFRAFKSDFYDRKGALLKTLTVNRHQLFKDRWWRSTELTMVNHVNGKSTQMLWGNYDFDTPLKEGDFTVRALERLQ